MCMNNKDKDVKDLWQVAIKTFFFTAGQDLSMCHFKAEGLRVI